MPADAQVEPSWIIYDTGPQGWAAFVLLTIIIGGLAAFATGRAAAKHWHPLPVAAAAMVPLAGAIRFLQYALTSAPLFSLNCYLVDLVILLAFSALGWRWTRTLQMSGQYPFAFERSGPLGWRARPSHHSSSSERS